jgi:hypothetical protein
MFGRRRKERAERDEFERRMLHEEQQHKIQVDERVARMEAEVRALSAYVQPSLRRA